MVRRREYPRRNGNQGDYQNPDQRNAQQDQPQTHPAQQAQPQQQKPQQPQQFHQQRPQRPPMRQQQPGNPQSQQEQPRQQPRQQYPQSHAHRDSNSPRGGYAGREREANPSHNASAQNSMPRYNRIKTEETVEDIQMDISRIEKEIELEIKEIRSLRIGL